MPDERYERMARDLAVEAHCRCAADIEFSVNEIAQALERAALEHTKLELESLAHENCMWCRQEWPSMRVFIHEDETTLFHLPPGHYPSDDHSSDNICEAQPEQRRIAAINKQLEELGK